MPTTVTLTADDVIKRAGNISAGWSTRNKKFLDWYNILLLKDELAQEDMESVVSNDPRTGYNMAKYLLTSSILSHAIPTEDLTEEGVSATSFMELFISQHWSRMEKLYRQRGRKGFLDELTSFLLATGWYNVFVDVTKDDISCEIWHPADTFQVFDDDGLSEVVHIYSVSAGSANRKYLKVTGNRPPNPFSAATKVYDYWLYDLDGAPSNAIVIGKELVKPATAYSNLNRIPVFSSSVSGLPDMGTLAKGKDWQQHYGESIVATDEGVIASYNKLKSYLQQIVRDTANPRWFEASNGSTPILRTQDMFKRGAVFRGSIGDVVTALPMPPIPIELRSMMMDSQNELQRGLFPWAVYGNVQQQISALAMYNVTSASLQVLTPYHEAIMGLFSDVDNFITDQLVNGGMRPYKFTKPQGLPLEFEFKVEGQIDIPGYLVQKLNAARMMNPQFRLSQTTTLDKQFPEIKDPMREIAKGRRDDAMNDPRAIAVDAIVAYRDEAIRLQNAKDPNRAKLYNALADSLEKQITGQFQQAATQTGQASGVNPAPTQQELQGTTQQLGNQLSSTGVPPNSPADQSGGAQQGVQ
jgi:hypothetical protein